ncbi:hypothetical protein [Agrobacterium larrymoorei]|uniref:Uncharacterized protein n=1 Tax=Agrobacterium larrymoorei TaxID=160699 RepID=A0ABU0ULY0_9HYPH|nr:hypothetical protein [Agrobacterium larrymoorei]MDQ1185966.1 hypothetical protein [Agrobacterium larrymoorei]
MSALLVYKETRFRQVDKCPLCQERRQEFWRSDEFETIDEPNVFTGTHRNCFTPNPDDKAAARFWCGLELSIDNFGEIISRINCPAASKEAAEELNRQIEDEFEDEE